MFVIQFNSHGFASSYCHYLYEVKKSARAWLTGPVFLELHSASLVMKCSQQRFRLIILELAARLRMIYN